LFVGLNDLAVFFGFCPKKGKYISNDRRVNIIDAYLIVNDACVNIIDRRISINDRRVKLIDGRMIVNDRRVNINDGRNGANDTRLHHCECRLCIILTARGSSPAKFTQFRGG